MGKKLEKNKMGKKLEKIKSFVSPKRFRPKTRKIVKKQNRRVRRATAESVFRRLAPAKKRENGNGQRSAEDFLLG